MTLDNTITRRSIVDTSTPDKNQTYVALTTGANVLIAGVAGKQIQVTGIILSTGTAGVYVLNSGADPIVTFNMSANIPVLDHINGEDGVLFSGTAGANLNMTVAGAASNAGVYLQYKYR